MLKRRRIRENTMKRSLHSVQNRCQIHSLCQMTSWKPLKINVIKLVSIDCKILLIEYIFGSEPRLLKLKSPVYVFGDFHGNMADLIAFSKLLWPLGMHLTPGSFLFLGDYVDRGQYSIEVLSHLFAQKIMLPDKVFMLLGNHELRAVNISFISVIVCT